MDTRTKILAASAVAVVTVFVAAGVVAWDQTRLSEDEANTIACHRFARDDDANSSPDWFKDYSSSEIKDETSGSIRDLIALGDSNESDFASGLAAVSAWEDVQDRCNEDYGIDIGNIYAVGDEGRSSAPSADDISEQLTESAGIPEDQADCAAEKVLDSSLNDDQLNAISDDDESDLDADEIAEVGEVLGDALIDCAV
ncbi:hypothetical protein [Nocardioides pelophilus]|uniref:hypothetical protein n=1 Tax=Nocardioides pelophilus TaxID=2172019 RepID=UPI001603B5C7|nr:hypothetical protein [Nocardioides pelophilus]